MMMTPDRFGRPLRSLRVSVTDRCNLRCQYCMPENDYVWLPREEVLSFEEIARLVDVFTDAGVDRVRITGGEPLLRRDLPVLIERLAARPAIQDLAMTTNGVLLARHVVALKRSGLQRITVSLDTLNPALLGVFPFVVMFIVTSVSTSTPRSSRASRPQPPSSAG